VYRQPVQPGVGQVPPAAVEPAPADQERPEVPALDEIIAAADLDAVDDLPGLEELKGAGFLEGRVPSGLAVPVPNDDTTLREDEDPLEDEELYRPLEPDEGSASDDPPF